MGNLIIEVENNVVKLLSDVVFFEGSKEAFIRNGKGSFSIQGKDSYRILVWLAAHLDGRQKVKDFLPCALNSRRRILDLINILISHGFARVSSAPTRQEKKTLNYCQEVSSFLAQYVDFPAKSLSRFNKTHYVCVGTGICLYNLVVTLLKYGAKHITVLAPNHEHKKINSYFKLFQQNNNRGTIFKLVVRNEKFTIKNKADDKNLKLLVAEDDTSFFRDSCQRNPILMSLPITSIIKPIGNNIFVTIDLIKSSIDYYIKSPTSQLKLSYIQRLSPAAVAIATGYIVFTFLCYYANIFPQLYTTQISIDQETLIGKFHDKNIFQNL
jgi:hypothetical protein